MSHRIYVSASTQKANIGVGQYGTEQDRMQFFADRVKYWLNTQKGKFVVFRNQSGWSLEQTADDCNSLACELFIDNHTNAGKIEQIAGDGGAEGSEIFYYTPSGITGNSYKLATSVYKHIAPLSPGKDRGIQPDINLYKSGLYVIRNTYPPAVVIEIIFHTNLQEVIDYLSRIDTYAKAEAVGLCEYCGEKWEETLTKEQTVETLVTHMLKDGIVTDKDHWIKVLMGEVHANPDWLQIAFSRAVNKIG